MKLSARDQLKGTVQTTTADSVNGEVVIEVAPGVRVTAVVTTASNVS